MPERPGIVEVRGPQRHLGEQIPLALDRAAQGRPRLAADGPRGRLPLAAGLTEETPMRTVRFAAALFLAACLAVPAATEDRGRDEWPPRPRVPGKLRLHLRERKQTPA